eukprot:1667334-Rhodomonas_salina.3
MVVDAADKGSRDRRELVEEARLRHQPPHQHLQPHPVPSESLFKFKRRDPRLPPSHCEPS